MKPAIAAITAAKKVPSWGVYAALRYAMKHGATFAQFSIAERNEEKRRTRQRIRSELAGYMT